MCCGVTVGNDTAASGPDIRGRSGCVFLCGDAAACAVRERKCVKVASAAFGVWFPTRAEDWVAGSVGCGVQAVRCLPGS